jgi:hypothetical protein
MFIIYYLGLVQQAKQWPQYQVDSVSPDDDDDDDDKLVYRLSRPLLRCIN